MNVNTLIEAMSRPGSVICRLPGPEKNWGMFASPLRILEADCPEMVRQVIAELEKCLASGHFAAGFIAYEAAAAFDSALETWPLNGFPYIWFGIYDKPPEPFCCPEGIYAWSGALNPELAEAEYAAMLAAVKAEILAGNIYQANYTFRSRGGARFSPERLFLSLYSAHPVPYAAYVNTGKNMMVSLSPELFIEKNGREVLSRPMKGTVSRAENPDDDRQRMQFLASDPKNLAENLMIVDMVRNDLGRICIPGTVRAEPLFDINTYETLHQMTSDVRGELPANISLWELLSAVFPAASITGAPKVSAMSVIRRHEQSPRKVYTGSIGCFNPQDDCCLNVAIRTLVTDDNSTELGIGGGIVYDSRIDDEWQEALLKSRFTNLAAPDFRILETMLWVHDKGVWCLAEHLRRAANSQRYFERNWNIGAVEMAVAEAVGKCMAQKFVRARIRLLVESDGTPNVEIYPFDHADSWSAKPKLKLCSEPTDSSDIFLYHKTDCREFYNRHFSRAKTEGFDEVVFFNERGELTEGAISNIFVRLDGKWYTPPLSCGLLPGIWREKMIAELAAAEIPITQTQLQHAEKIMIGNSLRGGAEAKIH